MTPLFTVATLASLHVHNKRSNTSPVVDINETKRLNK